MKGKIPLHFAEVCVSLSHGFKSSSSSLKLLTLPFEDDTEFLDESSSEGIGFLRGGRGAGIEK